MTIDRYSTNKDRTMQSTNNGGGMVINRRCDTPRCPRPPAKGARYHGLDYCAACHASKTQKVAA
jgi:hypothetical protein